MARRSPMNARYQKNTGPAGKTRKSAAGAKPKREAGAQGTAAPAKKKTSNKPTMREALAAMPTTPEMKKWRWRSLGLLALGLLIFTATTFIKPLAAIPAVSYVGLALYVICLSGAFYIDFKIIRKLRDEQRAAAKSDRKKG